MGEDRSPFHPGEQALQARVGRRELSERIGRRMILDFMPDEQRAFLATLPLVLAGSLDDAGHPWASVLSGAPGFLASPDARTLRIAARAAADDPLARHLAAGAPLGLLGLEFQGRRRVRVNGTVTHVRARDFNVRVEQSFANCPKYIQARAPIGKHTAPPGASHAEGGVLSARAAELAARADTFFIASAAPGAGVDVSHRGGRPGFVRVTAGRRRTVLAAPDFAGNSLFNTFGNLALHPSCGLLFVDFVNGDLLQLTGRAEVAWDGPELEAFAGARRLLRFDVAAGLLRERALPLRWTAAQQAAQLAATGAWTDVARHRQFPASCAPDNSR
jgi:predicted pyridoxine 5'-phosphate oxidase superfamily flavin-nucleotide-binding protein